MAEKLLVMKAQAFSPAEATLTAQTQTNQDEDGRKCKTLEMMTSSEEDGGLNQVHH